jgi:hypothetical protein
MLTWYEASHSPVEQLFVISRSVVFALAILRRQPSRAPTPDLFRRTVGPQIQLAIRLCTLASLHRPVGADLVPATRRTLLFQPLHPRFLFRNDAGHLELKPTRQTIHPPSLWGSNQTGRMPVRRQRTSPRNRAFYRSPI